ncbi:hypothetical protein HPB52_000186 [Rhipicephalus sanguineus]|uniref:Uncharacterized protein n=1 Tax=Rhipicephalus sanguineus TaxID=34632 RepID=A0A9D4PT42_RHISA|nr:hypothetical protein HPB52_000186 [Rhipicephalus sanguineus]
MDSVAPALLEELQKVIPEPKRRSEKWISSSVPQSRWHEPVAAHCSADYLVNNFLSPVIFYDALKHVPKDAILVEIAPHDLLQASGALVVSPDAEAQQPGLQLSVAVCRGRDESVAHVAVQMRMCLDAATFFLVQWGPQRTLTVAKEHMVLLASSSAESCVEVASGCTSPQHDQEEASPSSWEDLPDHNFYDFVIDDADADTDTTLLDDEEIESEEVNDPDTGQAPVPTTSQVMDAVDLLRRFAGVHEGAEDALISLASYENCAILRRTVDSSANTLGLMKRKAKNPLIFLSSLGPVRLSVSVLPLSGEFEIGHDGNVVATGRVRMAKEDENVLDKGPPGRPAEMIDYGLDGGDVYKELRLRGYEYSGEFQGILKADVQKPYGKLQWRDNWLCFIDAMIQFASLSEPLRSFVTPARIESCRIDPNIQADVSKTDGDIGVDVVYNHDQNTCRAGGAVIRGLHVSVAQRPALQQTPLIEAYRFIPYEDNEQAMRDREASLKDYVDFCEAIASRVVNCRSYETQQHFPNKGDACELNERAQKPRLPTFLENSGLLIVLAAIEESAKFSSFAASRSANFDATKHKLHKVESLGFEWVPPLKEKVLDAKRAEENIWLLSADTGPSGVIGLANCLRQESCGRHIRYCSDA